MVMASLQILIFRSLIFYFHLILLPVILVSSSDENGKCPSSFKCGNLGDIKFPFTDTEHPHCGVLAIHGCNDSAPVKTIQINNKPLPRFVVSELKPPNIIAIKDKSQQSYLGSKSCKAFSNNFTFPASPLGSIYMYNNFTFFKCNNSSTLSLPQQFHNYTNCSDQNIYYYAPPEGGVPQGFQWPRSLTACSQVQLAIENEPEGNDPFSFLSYLIELVVQESDACTKCINHQGGQCQLDTQGNFYCAGDKHLFLKLGLGIGLPSFIVIVLLISWLCKRKFVPQFYSNQQSESASVCFGVPVFSYKDLEVATKKFDRSTELGDGGFGTVYYGKLNDGREVAVKRLYEHNYKRVQQFMNEVQILTHLRHRNLVSLYGCTSRHSRELLLVYEYISNGTVACHLHGKLARTATLPWRTRMKIAIETAVSLVYLHASGIIHRDIKTNNILLDNSFTVKVADFGLSRLFPNDVTHVSTAPQGTPGYVDPEYHRCYQLTSKSDVYSFGVVLIELISSKPAVDMNRHRDEINLSDLAVKKIQKSAISELVDPSLGFDSDDEVKRMIIWVAELAFRCLQRERELRPSMDEVLKALRRIESGNDEGGRLEEVKVDDGDEGMMLSHVDDAYSTSPASPEHDGVELLKNMKERPSPKAVTEKWNSDCTSPNVSAESPSQTHVGTRSY